MAAGFRAEVTKSTKHVDPDFFGLAVYRMLLESPQELSGHILPLMFDRNIPGLMIDTRADDIHFFRFQSQDFGNLSVSSLDTVTQSNGPDFAVLITGPGHHGIGVGIVEQQTIRMGDFPDIPAEIQYSRYAPLSVHDSPSA